GRAERGVPVDVPGRAGPAGRHLRGLRGPADVAPAVLVGPAAARLDAPVHRAPVRPPATGTTSWRALTARPPSSGPASPAPAPSPPASSGRSGPAPATPRPARPARRSRPRP